MAETAGGTGSLAAGRRPAWVCDPPLNASLLDLGDPRRQGVRHSVRGARPGLRARGRGSAGAGRRVPQPGDRDLVVLRDHLDLAVVDVVVDGVNLGALLGVKLR